MTKSAEVLVDARQILAKLDASKIDFASDAASIIRALQEDNRDLRRKIREDAKVVADAHKRDRAASKAEERRVRVAKAFIALRAVQSLGTYPEQAIRYVRLQLQLLPARLAEMVELEDVETAELLIAHEAWRILDGLEAQLRESEDQPRTPANARYIAAERDLEVEDLQVAR